MTDQEKPFDVRVENHGTIAGLLPLTPEGRSWLEEHCPAGAWWGGRLMAEPRYVPDIVLGLMRDGLEVA